MAQIFVGCSLTENSSSLHNYISQEQMFCYNNLIVCLLSCRIKAMAAYGQTQYSPALQPAVPYAAYTHHTQGYSMPSYSEYKQTQYYV